MANLDIIETLGDPELAELLNAVDAKLQSAANSNVDSLNKSLSAIMINRGKKLRAILTLCVANLFGSGKQSVNAAAAIELIHLASLVHDDIIDDADTRWGDKTLSKQSGISQALLVGDYLLSAAQELAAVEDKKIAYEVSNAFKIVCEGQARELADVNNLSRTIDSYFSTIQDKTGALIASACKIGAICAEQDANTINTFYEFGLNFGIAFQLIDDLLDILSTPELAGKPVGNDVRQGVYTLPVILALNSKNALVYKQLIAEKDFFKLPKMLASDGFVNQTIKQIEDYNSAAIRSIQSTPGTKHLQQLPKKYFDWAKNKYIF